MLFYNMGILPFRSRGFTLIELLIVLVIVSIGLAIALPSVQSMTKRQRVNRVALMVASDIRSAFTSAARGRLPVQMHIPGDTSGYVITNRTTGDTIVQRHLENSGVRISSMTGGPATLNIYPNGVAMGADTVLVEAIAASPRVIKLVGVSRIGFVQVLP
jgi:prepilin-type N-terminal cleavage/methylation domain-containing protein